MKYRTCLLAALAVLLGAGLSLAAEPRQWVQGQLDELVELYRELHQAPELSFQEEQTARRMAAELKAIGAEVTTGIGGYGVVGMLKNGDGPMLMLRTDTDALPVTEDTGLAYASQVRVEDESGAEVGVMHACGHDVHMANLIGTARYLAAHKDQWRGTIMLLCQPAEERGAGAKAMLEDGLYERFGKPDFAVALHVDSSLATGRVGTRGGYTLANVDSIDITMHGRGGHGAYPHTTIDPIVQAAHLVLDLQTIVSREIAPTDPAVVTVGSIHGGTKHNVIGNSCELQLTIRSYSDSVRNHLLEAIRRKAKAVADSAGAPEPTIKVSEGTPALFNDEDLATRITEVFRRELGEENVVESEPSMGGEDFSRYAVGDVPILMFRLGAVDARRLARYKQLGQKPPSLHSSVFYPDADDALRTGVTAMTAVALELLPPGK